MAMHKYQAKHGSMFILHQSIRKHGWDNFSVDILYMSKDGNHVRKEMEPFFIKEYGTYGEGYNMTPGGDGSPTTPEKSAAISKAKKDKPLPWMVGHTHNNGSVWMNNGVESKHCHGEIPEGWVKGRLKGGTRGPRLNGTNRPKFENGYKKSTKPRKPMSDEHRAKIAASLVGTARAAGNKNVLGRVWVNNGAKNMRVLPDKIPEGFHKGRL